jgi:hypothetical protein
VERGKARARALAVALVAALLAPAALAPTASAGLVFSFVEGPTVTITAGVPSSVATLNFTNPSRAVNSSVDISNNGSLVRIPGPAPGKVQFSEPFSCPTLFEQPEEFLGPTLNASDRALLSGNEGLAWTQTGSVGGCPLLLVFFNLSSALGPGSAPPLYAQFALSGDLTTVPGWQNFTLVAWEQPAIGHAGWRAVALTSVSPGNFTGTLYHPPLVDQGGVPTLEVLLFAPGGGAFLTVDQIAVDLLAPDAPLSPDVVVEATGVPIWQFRSPSGGDAYFGRTLGDASGASSFDIASNGTAAQGFSGPLFIPAGASIREAYFDVLPAPFGDTRSNASGATNYTVDALSVNVTPLPPSIDRLPIEARPTQGLVTLYGLAEHGVLDASQGTSSTFNPAGNLTSSEESVAQTFAVEQDGAIERVQLLFADATGHPVGPLVLQIRTNASGFPSAASLATATVNATAARPGGWVNFTFSPPVAVTAGAKLALVLSSPGATAGQTWDWRARNGITTDPYANGTAQLSVSANGSGPWVNQSNVDMAFQVLLTTAFNESLSPFVEPAGSSGPGTRVANYNGSLTGWTFTVRGEAVNLAPDFAGGTSWQVPVVNGLGVSVSFRWDARLDFDINPRAVELAVGNRSAFVTLPELSRPQVVDFAAPLLAALSASDYQEVTVGAARYFEFELRVLSDGPASVRLGGFDISYDIRVTATGFDGAINTVAAAAPPTPTFQVALALRAPSGSVLLSNPRIILSDPPFSPPLTVPPLSVPEGAVNATLLHLRQWFIDDGGPLALTFAVVSVLPPVAVGAVYSSPLDADLTLTMTDPEFSGVLLVEVMAIDSTGLNVTRVFTVNVVNVDDPPVILQIPDIILANTTGTFDLRPYLRDNDTAISALNISVSSVFASVSGTNLTFDYREAPAGLLAETPTLWVADRTTNVSATFRVAVNNAGRPALTLPGEQTLVVGHAFSMPLDGLAVDDHDPAASLAWSLFIAYGVGPTPGDASASVQGHTLRVSPLIPGDVEVNLSVRDLEGNLAVAVLRFHIVANQPPSLGRLAGTSWTLSQGGELRISLADYLNDSDDAFSNHTFNLAGDNPSVAIATIEGGVLVVRPVGGAGGHVRVTLTAFDPANASSTASLEVEVAGGAGAPAGLFLPLTLFVLLGIAGLLYLSYRRGRERRPTLDKFEREDADLQEDEEDRPLKRLKSPEGLEATDEERMLDDLDRMDKEAVAPRIELPGVSIVGFAAKPAASTVLLVYRDGRPMSWVTTSSPSDEEAEKAQVLAAALAERARKAAPGEKIEWANVEAAGVKLAVEGRSQMVLGAVLEPGVDEAMVRLAMRAALDRVFDANAAVLKRWDGARGELKKVDDLLEPVFHADPNRRT